MLFDLICELISERGFVRFALDRNLTCRLIVGCDAHIRRWQAVEQMQQNFDWIKVWIDRRSQCLPIVGGCAHKNGARRIALNLAVELPRAKLQITKLDESERDNCSVDYSCYGQP